MNHLAHVLLAGDDPGLRLGGWLGDFVHGRTANLALPAAVVRGVSLHRAIDVFTDAHPRVAAARATLPPPWRRYAGILLDMWFDHALARDFAAWSAVPLPAWSAELRATLATRAALLPAPAQRFLAWMETNDLPAGYADRTTLRRAIGGIGQRLRRPNPLAAALPVLEERGVALDAAFQAFFPELQDFAARWIETH